MNDTLTPAHRIRVVAALAVAVVLASIVAVAPASGAPAGELAVQSVDTSGWPRVAVTVVLPADMLAAGQVHASDFTVTENGATVAASGVRSLGAARRPLSVVLVLDASGSMKGRALDDAKQAAARFVAAMGPGDRVSLVAFSDAPRVLSPFTTDRQALSGAIARVQATRETALYDAMTLATQQFAAAGDADRAIVLLSDGADTVSAATPDSVATALAEARVPVYAVALRTKDTDPTALSSLARASGGRMVSATGSDELSALFTGIAAQLKSPYEVVFTSLRPPAKDLEISLVVSSRDSRASVTAMAANPDYAGATPTEQSVVVPLPSPLWPPAIALLAFAAVGLLVGGVLLLTRPEPNSMDQLRFYEQLHERTGASGGSAEEAVDPDSARGRMIGVARTVASRGGFDRAMRTELERAGLPLRPVEYMILHVSVVLGAGFLTQLLVARPLATAVVVLLLALGPIVLLSRMGRKRTESFQEQLPDALNLLSGSLRSGWGLLQAIGIVVSEMPAPAGPEFGRVVTEARLGLPLEDALEKMAERMGSEDFRWAVTAIAIQREVGGNLAEVLDLVAQTVRDRASLRRQVSALTGEGRLSAIILVVLPFFEAFVLWMLNPNYFTRLFSNTLGLVMTLSAALLIAVGSLWLQRIVKIEV